MTELEKLVYTKSFIDKLANGINPLDGSTIPENEIINNVRISRCLFYVSSILQKNIEINSTVSKKKSRKRTREPFSITSEQLQNFEYSELPISASAIARKINWLVKESIDAKEMQRFSYKMIVNWLTSICMVEWKEWTNGKMRCFPTAEGEAVGLGLIIWEKYGKSYPTVVFSEGAQHFIIDNIDAILATEAVDNNSPNEDLESLEE